MITKTLYRLNLLDGSTIVTPNKPLYETTYTETYRLIADEGKILTDGNNTYSCVDTDKPEKFMEVDEASSSEMYAEAWNIITGVTE